MKTYSVTVTDYTTKQSETYTVEAATGDDAFDEACRRLDTSETHSMGGSFHRAEPCPWDAGHGPYQWQGETCDGSHR